MSDPLPPDLRSVAEKIMTALAAWLSEQTFSVKVQAGWSWGDIETTLSKLKTTDPALILAILGPRQQGPDSRQSGPLPTDCGMRLTVLAKLPATESDRVKRLSEMGRLMDELFLAVRDLTLALPAPEGYEATAPAEAGRTGEMTGSEPLPEDLRYSDLWASVIETQFSVTL
jgi:hypothetical protein